MTGGSQPPGGNDKHTLTNRREGYKYKGLATLCDRVFGSRVPDYCNYNTGVRALYVGGNYNNGTNAGPFYLNGNNAPSNTNGNLGSRLLIQETVSPRSLFHTAR